MKWSHQPCSACLETKEFCENRESQPRASLKVAKSIIVKCDLPTCSWCGKVGPVIALLRSDDKVSRKDVKLHAFLFNRAETRERKMRRGGRVRGLNTCPMNLFDCDIGKC